VLGSEKVLLEGTQNQQFHAEDVIVTIPPSLWGTIKFNPPLPPEMAVQMGSAVKYLSPVKGKYWEASKKGTDSLSDTELQMTWLATEGQGEGTQVLTCFGGGPSVEQFRNRTPQSRRMVVADHLNSLLPGFADNTLPEVRYMDWTGDPQVRGSYSFAAPGQIMAAGPLLKKGIGRMHFAGEHTCFKFCGYMEGALRSGVDAAWKLVQRDGLALGRPLHSEAIS